MSTELVHTQSALDEKMAWSKALATSDMLPRQFKGNPASLLFACEFADALGIPRINALTSIYVIDGKPTASADLISGLVRKAGHKLRVSGDDTTATAQIVRCDDPDFTFEATWNLDRAKVAGLLGKKGPWQNYPAAMLRSRAITEVARMAASDALYGCIYTSEELGANVTEDGTPIITNVPQRQEPPTAPRNGNGNGGGRTIFDAKGITRPEPAPEPAAEPAVDADNLVAAIDATDDPDVLRQVWQQCGGLPDEQRDDLRTVITAKVQARQDYLDAAATEETVDAELVEDGVSE